jgi:hypothetical protein
MKRTVAALTRQDGMLPQGCSAGSRVNLVLRNYPENGCNTTLLHLVTEAEQGWECVEPNRPTCLGCPNAMDLLSGEVSSWMGDVGTPTAIESVLSMWVTEGTAGEVRPLCTLCPESEIAGYLLENGWLPAQIPCFQKIACIDCDKGQVEIADILLELVEQGWEGPRTREIKKLSGYL